eukprot:5645285-Amphidinium_carterae.1
MSAPSGHKPKLLSAVAVLDCRCTGQRSGLLGVTTQLNTQIDWLLSPESARENGVVNLDVLCFQSKLAH